VKRIPSLFALLLVAASCRQTPASVQGSGSPTQPEPRAAATGPEGAEPVAAGDDPTSRPPCGGARLEGSAESYKETTNPTISGFDVGISNIFERDLADDAGVKQKRLSASLSIHDPKTDAVRREIVVPGNVVTINTDRYCIVGVDGGTKDQPGSVSLQKLAP
jgi:hypothetical protein